MRPLPLTARWTKLAIFAGAAAILLVGALVAPRPSDVAAPLPEPAAPLIEEEVRSAEPLRLLDALREAIRPQVASTVAFEIPPNRPESSPQPADWRIVRPAPGATTVLGVVVSASGDILTSAAAVGHDLTRPVRLTNERVTDGRVIVFDPEQGLALVQVPSTERLPPSLFGVAAPGQAVAAAGRADGGDFIAPATLVRGEGDRDTLAGAPQTLPAGTPVFDFEGRAVAILVLDARGPHAYPIAAALQRVRRLRDEGRAAPSAAGITFQAIAPALQPFFSGGAVVICDVAEDSPAAAAGLRPGDVLQDIAGEEVSDPEQARAAVTRLPARQPAPFTLSRRGRPLTVSVVPDSVVGAPWIAASASRQRPATARRAADVFRADVLERAHVPADALVLTVGGRTVRRVARVTAPLLVYLDQDGSRYFAVVGPRP